MKTTVSQIVKDLKKRGYKGKINLRQEIGLFGKAYDTIVIYLDDEAFGLWSIEKATFVA